MKMKKPQARMSWTAVLAALGATAVMLPVHAQYQQGGAGMGASQWEQSRPPGAQGQGMAGPPAGAQQTQQGGNAAGAPAGAQAPTSVWQPEAGNAPGRDAAGSPGAPGMGAGMDAPSQGGPSQWEQSRPPGSQGQGYSGPPAGSPGDSGLQAPSPDAQGMGMGMQGQDAAGMQGAQQPGGLGGMPSDKPLTSTHQPEMSNAPGQQGPGALDSGQQGGMPSRDAQGMGMGSPGGAGMTGSPQGGSPGMGMQDSQPQGGMGGMPADKPPTSTHQPEMSTAPGQQGPGAQGAMGMPGQQGIQTDQRSLTRAEVRAETEAWREAGLLDSMMGGEYSSSWVDPQEQQMRDQLNREIQAQRGMSDPGYGTRDAGGMGPGGSR